MLNGIEVAAAIIWRRGEVLVARRAAGKHLAGYWEFPGGKLEEGESAEYCLARELEEEFGIAVVVGGFVAASVYDYGHKIVRLLAYDVEHVSGEFRLTDHDAIEWRTPAALGSVRLAPADVAIAEVLLGRQTSEPP